MVGVLTIQVGATGLRARLLGQVSCLRAVHLSLFLARCSAFSTKSARGCPIPSASILQSSIEMLRSPASKVTMPVRPTPLISASFFCERPACSLASVNTAARASANRSASFWLKLQN